MKLSSAAPGLSVVISSRVRVPRALPPQPTTVEIEVGSTDANTASKAGRDSSLTARASTGAITLPLATSGSSFDPSLGFGGSEFIGVDGALYELFHASPTGGVVERLVFGEFFRGPSGTVGAGCEDLAA